MGKIFLGPKIKLGLRSMPQNKEDTYTREAAGMAPADWYAGAEELAAYEGSNPEEAAGNGGFWT